MSVPTCLLKIYFFVFVLGNCTLVKSQSHAPTPSFVGKAYLSEDGWYLHFLNQEQALFNLDTVRYSIIADTLHMVAIRTWMGEQQHKLREDYMYGLLMAGDSLQLRPLKLPYSDIKKAEAIVLKDISTLSAHFSLFKSFAVTRQLYLTSGGEWDSTGQVRSDTVYTITTATLYRDRRFVTEVKHLRRTQT